MSLATGHFDVVDGAVGAAAVINPSAPSKASANKAVDADVRSSSSTNNFNRIKIDGSQEKSRSKAAAAAVNLSALVGGKTLLTKGRRKGSKKEC